ncbi:hypothetical protein EDD21DRAFT_419884 [Dissophora ornata]|nr:hypothetical protein EDD21DRAFT_419884 [Dissophora ornata]
MRIVNTVRSVLTAVLALGSIADARSWTYAKSLCQGGSTLVTGTGCIALNTIGSRSAVTTGNNNFGRFFDESQSCSSGSGAVSECGNCVGSTDDLGFVSTKAFATKQICTSRTLLGRQMEYIEAHIDLSEYHIFRENDEIFKCKKDEHSNRDMHMDEKPYNAEKIVFPVNL